MQLTPRKVILAALCAMVGVGVVGTCFVLFSSMGMPAYRRVETVLDVADLQPGQIAKFEIAGTPVWVLHRTSEMIKDLAFSTRLLLDPNSTASVQPGSMRTPLRSLRNEYFVFIPQFNLRNVSSGTLGVDYAPPQDLPPRWGHGLSHWTGGFRDTAGKDFVFDGAGRVLVCEVCAWATGYGNLPVPPYSFQGTHKIVVSAKPNIALEFVRFAQWDAPTTARASP
ncbi:MAG: hypothetical protein ABL931_12025 [Usitatibacteraceae bacterium]